VFTEVGPGLYFRARLTYVHIMILYGTERFGGDGVRAVDAGCVLEGQRDT